MKSLESLLLGEKSNFYRRDRGEHRGFSLTLILKTEDGGRKTEDSLDFQFSIFNFQFGMRKGNWTPDNDFLGQAGRANPPTADKFELPKKATFTAETAENAEIP
jgi:hypothetical protein